MTEKHQILETITAISRIILLAFKPHKTKIAIRDHNVVLCEQAPDKYYGITLSQSIDRYWNGDSREDIYILNHVIINFIEWYVIPYKKTDVEIYTGLMNMVKYLCVALKKLQATYKTGNVVGMIQYYIIVLFAVIEDKFYPELLYTNNTFPQNSFMDDIKTEDEMLYSTIFDINKIRSFWSREELKSICEQFNKCFRQLDEEEPNIFKEINDEKNNNNNISKNIDRPHISEDNKENCNSYDIKKSMLPVPRCKHNAIVKGHLVGITNILDTMDRKFRSILNQSVKGSN